MINPQDIRVTSYLPQSGYGAGGMTVGLTTSGMIAHHIPTGIGISCDSERSQWANKEKALQMLTSLLLAIESEKNFERLQPQVVLPGWDVETTPDYYSVNDQATWHSASEQVEFKVSGPDKVQMIKDVRQKAGCGLKEAKEAVDKMGTVEGALLHLTGSTGYIAPLKGYCSEGGACVCGGDLPAIREGCYNWQK